MNRASAKRYGYPLVGALFLLLVWHFSVRIFGLPPVVLPTPEQVFDAFLNQRMLLLDQGWITLKECIYGFVLAFVTGVPIAVAIAGSKLLNQAFYPLLIAMQSVPKIALAPIVLVWFGIGIESKLVIVWLVAFFPIVVDTSAGLRATPKAYIELAHSLQSSPLQLFCKFQFPSSLPFILSGSKVAITLAVIGAVIAEFVGSNQGLGNLLLAANSQLNTPLAFAALFALAFLGIVLYGVVVLAETLLEPWLPADSTSAA
ncbi:MAG TPA: ABC transporter permease [Castellaniella sp.]|uniref:ABC transporter permease n=1 Tax=Castellaniella sp. TaxID=1955812 RepID=UPI002EF03F63